MSASWKAPTRECFDGRRLERLKHEADAADRRAEYSGQTPWVELPSRLEHPTLKVVVRGGKRYAVSDDVRAYVSEVSK